MKKSTEKSSNYNDIEKMDTISILQNINKEDQLVALAVYNEISKIEELVDVIYTKMLNGGRLFYIGAGTSGRLGIVDASECPPTFGVEHGLVVGLIAGGDSAIRKAWYDAYFMVFYKLKQWHKPANFPVAWNYNELANARIY